MFIIPLGILLISYISTFRTISGLYLETVGYFKIIHFFLLLYFGNEFKNMFYRRIKCDVISMRLPKFRAREL